MIEIPGAEFDLEVDLVLLALGFVHPEREGMLEQLGRGPGRSRQRLDLREQNDLRSRRLRSGRHGAGPVAGRYGRWPKAARPREASTSTLWGLPRCRGLWVVCR